MNVIRIGDLFMVKIDTGEGLLYRVTHDLVTPFSFIKTLTIEEVKEHETKS